MQNPEKQPLHEIYKGGFFKNRHKLIWRVPIFCDAIIKVFNPLSVIDVGCAIGDFVKGFRDKDIFSIGLEGSEASIPFMVTDDYVICDLRERAKLNFSFDYSLCMCLEVAEHIEEEYSEVFIENLCLLSNNILISAAPPGQKGHYHVNCQNIEYWDKIFMGFSYIRDDSYSDSVIAEISGYKHKPGLKAYCDNLHFYKYQKGASYD